MSKQTGSRNFSFPLHITCKSTVAGCRLSPLGGNNGTVQPAISAAQCTSDVYIPEETPGIEWSADHFVEYGLPARVCVPKWTRNN
ncbi:hypothetical protein JTB14_019222 [Gonioctena quinquepunctata]|nr:hypothetical protein JTB14_019222 [Gonioctena quinquepunctata]